MIPLIHFPSILPLLGIGDFLAGEYFIIFGDPLSGDGQILVKVDDKDNVKEKHYTGAAVTGTLVKTQTYYSPYSESELDIKPATGKELLCYYTGTSSGGGQFSSGTWKLWANTTKDSKTSARDIFNRAWTSSNVTQVPPFILKAGEYLNLERISGSDTNVFMTKFVAVERDAT